MSLVHLTTNTLFHSLIMHIKQCCDIQIYFEFLTKSGYLGYLDHRASDPWVFFNPQLMKKIELSKSKSAQKIPVIYDIPRLLPEIS